VDIAKEYVAQVRELAITYSSGDSSPIRAVDGIGIDIRAGEIVGILGESGCGKTTLAGALLRLLPPNARYESGTILIRGQELLKLPGKELQLVRGRVNLADPTGSGPCTQSRNDGRLASRRGSARAFGR